MTKLVMGIVNMPYADAKKGKKGSNSGGGTTTLEVAKILESKYHIMQHFWDIHGQEIADDLAKGYRDALKSRMMGGTPAGFDPSGTAMSKTATRFNKFIDNREMEKLGIAGVPTKAALRGVNHRLAHPYANKNKRRPSFDDTGLYKSNFRTWLEEK
jgi:hypothetical protein